MRWFSSTIVVCQGQDNIAQYKGSTCTQQHLHTKQKRKLLNSATEPRILSTPLSIRNQLYIYNLYPLQPPKMAPHPVFKAGNTALITGAASGIGLAVAKLCRNHGMKLALVDNNTQALSQAKGLFRDGEDMQTYAMDVSKIEEWKDLKPKVDKSFGRVDFLMLNAGIGLKGGWEDTEYFHKVLFPPFQRPISTP